jgi:hypothetical protein
MFDDQHQKVFVK